MSDTPSRRILSAEEAREALKRGASIRHLYWEDGFYLRAHRFLRTPVLHSPRGPADVEVKWDSTIMSSDDWLIVDDPLEHATCTEKPPEQPKATGTPAGMTYTEALLFLTHKMSVVTDKNRHFSILQGNAVRRKGWNAIVHIPNVATSRLVELNITTTHPFRTTTRWVPTVDDVRATDWEIVTDYPILVNATERTTESQEPRPSDMLTKEQLERKIVSESYHVFPGTTMTICLLTLENGFHSVGKSACVSLENFDSKIGRDLAREDAFEKIWQLEGYLLKQRLFEAR